MSQKKGTDNPLAAPAKVRIGVAGWSYSDWNGYVYPTKRPKDFHEAAFLAQYFDAIEINTSFYYPIQPDHAKLWLDHVSFNPAFLFTTKLWQRFTHEASATKEDEQTVRAGFDVLRNAGKLGAVLLQFPFSFHRSPETETHLTSLLKRFSDFPLVVELRHGSWQTPATFELLRQHNAGFCNIDQPVIGNSLQPTAEVTSPIAYVRLHGRRYDTWFTDEPDVPSFERYNYLYSEQELLPWADRTREIEQAAHDVYVITNNHYQGKGAVNALQLIAILKGEKLKVPEDLRTHYPQLNEIAKEMPATPTLFPMGAPATKGTKRKSG
jgi:uncharacterized protein YecE (DUF72 family)